VEEVVELTQIREALVVLVAVVMVAVVLAQVLADLQILALEVVVVLLMQTHMQLVVPADQALLLLNIGTQHNGTLCKT
jgi:hypothetical protein